MAKHTLPPGVEVRIQHILNQTDWEAKFPKGTERMTAYRAAKERVTALVVAEEAAKQARETEKAAREAQAALARWGAGGKA